MDDATLQVYKDGDYGAYLDLESSLAEQSEEIEGLHSRYLSHFTITLDAKKLNKTSTEVLVNFNEMCKVFWSNGRLNGARNY